MSDSRSPHTLGLVGHPVGHSKSAALYTAAYERLNLPWVYKTVDAPCEDKARQTVQNQDYYSLNITTPYKSLAFKLASAHAATAKLAQGANIVVRKNDALLAFNTDGQGCISYLERTGFSCAGKRVVICGSGVTACAIMHAAALAGSAALCLVSRKDEVSHQVLSAYTQRLTHLATTAVDVAPANPTYRTLQQILHHAIFSSGSYESAQGAFDSADLVINATPLGMVSTDKAPFDTGLLHAGQVVFDVVYGHGETALLREAKQVGCLAYNGEGMLCAQALACLHITCDVSGIEVEASENELFTLMAKAAGFSC